MQVGILLLVALAVFPLVVKLIIEIEERVESRSERPEAEARAG